MLYFFCVFFCVAKLRSYLVEGLLSTGPPLLVFISSTGHHFLFISIDCFLFYSAFFGSVWFLLVLGWYSAKGFGFWLLSLHLSFWSPCLVPFHLCWWVNLLPVWVNQVLLFGTNSYFVIVFFFCIRSFVVHERLNLP